MLRTKKRRESGSKPIETTSSLLSHVNQLVSQGLRQTAIDLLEEAVSDAPNDVSLLNALGRIYLLDRQPDKAVIYLRRSLAHKNVNPIFEDEYVPEAFTDADAEYLEEEVEDLTSDEFSILDEEDSGEKAVEKPQSSRSRTLHLNRSRSKRLEKTKTEGAEPLIPVFKKGKKRVEARHLLKSEEASSSPQAPYEPEESNAAGDKEVEKASKGGKLTTAATSLVRSEPVAAPHVPEVLEEPKSIDLATLYDDYGYSYEEFELPEIESDNLDYVDIDEDENFDDDLNEVEAEIYLAESVPLDDDFTSEDFGWEDLDDFDEDASRKNEDEELAQTGLTRAQRARQAAVDVLNRVGWNLEHLPLLEAIFVESGWGAARIAIEDQIGRGAVPDEIVLARRVRSIWFNSQHLWTSFRMKSNAPFMQAEAVYKNFSWVDALRLIRCFPSIPDASEVEAFIDDMYDEWYTNDRLRRHFKAFLKYFRYRVVASKRTLPGDVSFQFSLPTEAEWGVDNPELMSAISEMRTNLRELGADSGLAMPGNENKFKVLPKEAFD